LQPRRLCLPRGLREISAAGSDKRIAPADELDGRDDQGGVGQLRTRGVGRRRKKQGTDALERRLCAALLTLTLSLVFGGLSIAAGRDLVKVRVAVVELSDLTEQVGVPLVPAGAMRPT
jgi:hypothetical protein